MIGKIEIFKTGRAKFSLILAFLLLALGSGASYASDPQKGSRFYATQCASCHGPTGTSVMPGAPNFSRGDRMMQPDALLLTSIKAGKNSMPAYRGILSDTDILDVIAYLRTLH
jgi:cytochrome c6